MRFSARWYCSGAFDSGRLEAEMPKREPMGVGWNCFLSIFHNVSFWAQSSMVKVDSTDQSIACRQTCIDNGTRSSSRV